MRESILTFNKDETRQTGATRSTEIDKGTSIKDVHAISGILNPLCPDICMVLSILSRVLSKILDPLHSPHSLDLYE